MTTQRATLSMIGFVLVVTLVGLTVQYAKSIETKTADQTFTSGVSGEQFMPGVLLVDVDHRFTQATVITKLAEAGLTVDPKTKPAYAVIVIKALKQDQPIDQAIAQLEASGVLTCFEPDPYDSYLFSCRSGDQIQTELETILATAQVTDSSIHYSSQILVFVPVHEELSWENQLNSWEEISGVSPNWLFESY